MTGLVAHTVSPLSVHGYAVDNAVGVDLLDCCFPLNGRGAIVGGLWTASVFGVAGGGFLTATGPSVIALA